MTTNTNELRAAAERQCDNRTNDGPDAYMLAVAYLAEHPADDDEPWDSAWLASEFGAFGYLSTAKQENTDEWMDRLAERMNQVYEAFGESGRVRYVGSNVGGWIEKVCPQCGGEGCVDSGGFREDGHPIPVPCGECCR